MWKLLLALLVFLLPGVAFAVNEDCTFPTGAVDWGPIITITGVNCPDKAAAPDGDDIIIIPDGSHVTVIDDILFTADGSGIICESGGSITIDAVSLDVGIGIEFFDGQDTEPAAEGQVAFYAEAGCEINFSGGFRPWGPAVPVALATHTITNQTEWTIDYVNACGIHGAEIDCTGGNENLMCFYWTDLRSQNAVTTGETEGDNHLDEAIAAIDDGIDEACFIGDSPESPWCYPIDSATYGVGVSTMCLDITQWPWNRASGVQDSLDQPVATRAVQWDADGVATDAYRGDTCIEVDTNYITASGDFVGRWFRPQEEQYPYKIIKTFHDTDCDGGGAAGTDAIHIGTPLRNDIVTGTEEDFTIDYGFARGDTFVVVAPVALSIDDTAADDEGKIVIQSTDANISQTFVSGAGELRFDTAAGTWECIHVREGGDEVDSLASVRFVTVANPEVNCFTVLGGDMVDGETPQVVYEGTTGTARITNAGFRYSGASNISTTNAAAGDLLELNKIKLELIGVTAGGVGGGGISNGFSPGFDKVTGRNLACFGCTEDDLGVSYGVFSSHDDNKMVMDNVVVWGLTSGVITNEIAVSADVTINNLLAKGLLPYVGGGGSTLPPFINHCDVSDVVLTSPGAGLAGASMTSTGYSAEYENCVFSDITTKGRVPFYLGDKAKNNIFWNVHTSTSTNASCVTSNECRVIEIEEPNTAGVWEIFENITIGWDEGVDSDFNVGVFMETDAGHAAEDSFRFGSVLVYNLLNDGATAGVVYSEDIIDGVPTIADYSAGAHCSFALYASGGATYVDFDDVDDYPATAILRGYPPRFINPDDEAWTLATGSKLVNSNCGAFTGVRSPGVMRNGTQWMYKSIGVTPPLQGIRGSFPWSN